MSSPSYPEAIPLEDSPGGSPSYPGAQPVDPTWQQQQMTHLGDLGYRYTQRTPGVDYGGLDDRVLRQEFAMADDPEEEKAVLNRMLGEKGWARDSGGRIIVLPEGLKARGYSDLSKSVSLEPYLVPDALDVLEFATEAGAPIAGAAAGAAVGSPFGPPGALVGGILGAMGGRGVQELYEGLTGRNLQTPAQVAGDIGFEGTMAAVPLGLKGVTLDPLGRGVLAPKAQALQPGAMFPQPTPVTAGPQPALPPFQGPLTTASPQVGLGPLASGQGAPILPTDPDAVARQALARDLGLEPTYAQILTQPGLPGRSLAIAERIFPASGRLQRNLGRLRKELDALTEALPTVAEPGEAVLTGVARGHKMIQEWADAALYSPIRKRLGEEPIMGTMNLRKAVNDLWKELPKDTKGNPLSLPRDAAAQLAGLKDAAPQMTWDQMQNLRTQLRELASNPALLEAGIKRGQLKQLAAAAKRDRLNVPDKALRRRIEWADRRYAEEMERYSGKFMEKMLKDSLAKGTDLDTVISFAFKPDRPDRMRRLMKVLPSEAEKNQFRAGVWEQIRREAAPSGRSVDVVASAAGERPQGIKPLSVILDKYGDETLRAVFGPRKLREYRRLAKGIDLIGRSQKDYGQLVAAAIAARPLKNIGRLATEKTKGKFLGSEAGYRWLTEGLDAPTARAVINFLTTGTVMGPWAGEGRSED